MIKLNLCGISFVVAVGLSLSTVFSATQASELASSSYEVELPSDSLAKLKPAEPNWYKTTIYFIDEGGKISPEEVYFEDFNGRAVFGGDMVLGSTKDLLHGNGEMIINSINQFGTLSEFSELNAADIHPNGFYKDRRKRHWPNGVVPYVITSDFNSQNRQIIRRAMETIESAANIRFVERSGQTNYVTIKASDRCWSHVGRYQRKWYNNNKNEIGLILQSGREPHCMHESVIIHELMHTLSYFHEHQRPDRDQHIQLFPDNVRSDINYHTNYQKLSYDRNKTNGPYDFSSIMHYGSYLGSKRGSDDLLLPVLLKHDGSIINRNNHLSSGDINALRAIYGQPIIEPAVRWSSMQWYSCQAWHQGWGELTWDPVSSGLTYDVEVNGQMQHTSTTSMMLTVYGSSNVRIRARSSSATGSWHNTTITAPTCDSPIIIH